ncbi:MAG: hypothetical protein DLD55_00005, partial [candidate division SR1 bacterium]
MYKVKDNAEAQLQFGISSVATTLVVKEGQGAKFPEVPFLVVLNKRNSDGEITKSEKVEVSAVNRDQFTISRGYEGTTPSDFSADDFVSLFVLAKHIEELQTEVVKKANQTEVESVAQRTDSLEEKITTAENKIEKLEESEVSDYLGIRSIVAEALKKNNEVYKYHLPLFSEIISDVNIGKSETTKEIHILRLCNGVAFNAIQLPLKKTGEPTQNLIIEIRKAKKGSDSGLDFFVGGDVLATTTVNHEEITTSYQMKTISFSQMITFKKNEFAVVVAKQQNTTVNGTNYYSIGMSENGSIGYGVVAVNGDLKTKTFANVVCNSDGFFSDVVFGGDVFLFKNISKNISGFLSQSPKKTLHTIKAYSNKFQIRFKVRCSNWTSSSGSSQGGMPIYIGDKIIMSYPFGQMVEKTAVLSMEPQLFSELEIYIKTNGSNYSSTHGSCNIEVKMEIIPNKGDISITKMHSRNNVSVGEFGDFTIFGTHSDGGWKGGLPTGPITVAINGNKSGNGTETFSFYNPTPTLAKIKNQLSWNNNYSNTITGTVKVKVGGVILTTLSTNQSSTLDLTYLLLPEGRIDLEVYARHTGGYTPTVKYSV